LKYIIKIINKVEFASEFPSHRRSFNHLRKEGQAIG